VTSAIKDLTMSMWFHAGLFQMRHLTLTTPRDFGLSRYFSIVKFNLIEAAKLDYRKIH
jgi:hypothetical protein